MVEKLRPDELEAFKEAFDMFDKNMDGTISTKELHAAMRRGGQNPTESEVQDMINTVNVKNINPKMRCECFSINFLENVMLRQRANHLRDIE